MKRLFIIAATVLASLLLFSCSKEAETSKIVGIWEVSVLELTFQGETISVNAEDAGVEAEIIFVENGTGITKSGDSTDTFTYTYENDIVTITSKGETESLPVSIDGETMIIMIDELIMEGMKYSGKVYLVKK